MALRLSGLPVDSSFAGRTGDAAIRHFLCPRFTYPLGIHRQRLFQHIQRHRLRQTAVHTGLQATLFLFRQRVRRPAAARQRQPKLPDTLRQALAVHVRHVHIAQNNIDSIFTQHIQSVHAIIGCLTLIPQRSQLIGQQAAIDRMIVNDQNHHVVI